MLRAEVLMRVIISRLKYFYFAYFSKPAPVRKLYRSIVRRRIARILEMGLTSPRQSRKLIEVAGLLRPVGDVSYTAIDLFELRPAGTEAGVSLRLAYRELASTGARIRLIPGDPYTALARRANDLLDRDLIVISAEQDPEALARAWFYLPRMMHANTVVFQQLSGNGSPQPVYREVSREEIVRLAESAGNRRAA